MNERLCRLIDQRNLDRMVWRLWVKGEIIHPEIAWYGKLEGFLVWPPKPPEKDLMMRVLPK